MRGCSASSLDLDKSSLGDEVGVKGAVNFGDDGFKDDNNIFGDDGFEDVNLEAVDAFKGDDSLRGMALLLGINLLN